MFSSPISLSVKKNEKQCQIQVVVVNFISVTDWYAVNTQYMEHGNILLFHAFLSPCLTNSALPFPYFFSFRLSVDLQ